ncbi:MAG: hypothetical protein OJF55_001456 [Rhodanobacteraceae bacterium]|jgi:hypothetical protein|nr:MAG: hypothetical protein OJF55_001456 [Rhodanobacteraceae bacterium]
MRPVPRRTAVTAACLSVLLLAACGKHVASNAPITYAPADTPYLFANFKGAPAQVAATWGEASDSMISLRIQQLGRIAASLSDRDPEMAKVLDAVQAELADVHSTREMAQTLGLSQSALSAIYGIGDVPVARVELASPGNFKAFWARVEKRAGVTTPTATLDKQTYWVIGGNDAKLHVLVAIEGSQLVATVAPANASPDMLRQLLGLTKPASNAADRLAKLNGEHGYSDYGSGYVDLPKLFANLYDGKDAITQEFAKDLGGSLANPVCASEFTSLADQAPLASVGFRTYSAQEMRYSIDVQLAPSLLGALTALKQPVPGMDEAPDGSMFDMVMALPLKKWQDFVQGRAKAAAEKTYQCPALQSLNRFAQTAANPPLQMPPESASLLGFRVVLDKWEAGPQIAGRVLVASSNPAALTQQIQQTLPQFALKTIPIDGKPVAFDLPPQWQATLGGGNQAWLAANANALVTGIGEDEEARLPGTLSAPAGNGDRLMRMHLDGKMYGVLGNWIGRLAAVAPPQNQAQLQQMVGMFQQMGKMIASVDLDVKLDDKGLHVEGDTRHR